MAIDTDDKKLSLMESEIWEPGIVLAETSPFDQGDKQQLLWGYPGILWAAVVVADVTRRGQSNFGFSFKSTWR